MQPKMELLSEELVQKILAEAFILMTKPGIKVQSEEARNLLIAAGSYLIPGTDVIQIPENLARTALDTVPRSFYLYDRKGNPTVHYGGDDVHFDPGSSCVHVLDPETLEHRPSQSADLVRLVQVAEMLPQVAAQSTAVVCDDVAKDVGDLYRLFLVLTYSDKPIVTGAFTAHTTQVMIDLLAADSGGGGA